MPSPRSLSLFFSSFSSVLFVWFFEERKIRGNRLEGKVPVSTVSTPSGRRTRPRTSESGGGRRRARAFGHVQVTSTLLGLVSSTATGALYQRVIAPAVFFLGGGGGVPLVVGRVVVFFLFFFFLLSLSLSPLLALHAWPRRTWIPFGDHPCKLQRHRGVAWPLRTDDKFGTMFCYV